jgi:hypothetical protein
MRAAVAGPPEKPSAPVPATVVIVPPGETRRIRLFSVVGEQGAAVARGRHVDRRVELGGGGPAAVAGESLLAVAGHGGDRPGRRDAPDAVVAGVGGEHAAGQRASWRRRRRRSHRACSALARWRLSSVVVRHGVTGLPTQFHRNRRSPDCVWASMDFGVAIVIVGALVCASALRRHDRDPGSGDHSGWDVDRDGF